MRARRTVLVPLVVVAGLVLASALPAQAAAGRRSGSRPVVAARVVDPAHEPGTFRPVQTWRVLDTRSGLGAPAGAIPATGSVDVTITGRAGVPGDVSAVAINLTAVAPTANGFLTAYAQGAGRPATSNLNYLRGQNRSNLAIVPVSSAGAITLYNGSSGPAQVLGDIEGYYLGGTATTPGAFTSLTPARLLDTRTGAGSPVGPAGDLSFDVAGVGGVPASGVSSVVLNLTAVAPAASGYLTAYASGTSRPVVSTLNFAPGRTTPNLATVTLGANGRVTLHNGSSGSTHYVADVFGYYLSGTATAVGAFVPISPRRAIDTRTGTGSPRKALPGGYELFSSLSLPSNASAAVLNVTATGAGRTGFLAAPPQLPLFSGAPTEQPRGSRTSTLSYLPGQSVAGLAVMPLNRGQSAIYNGGGGAVQVIADIVGYTVGPTMAWSAGTKIAMFDVTAVSCSSDSFCVALDNEDKATLYDGTSWGTSVVVLPGLDPQAGSASCVSPTFCVVVDKDIDQVVHATTYNGTTWSTPVTLGSIASHVAQTYVRVSCPTTTFCLAGYDKLRFYNGSSWSTETTVAGMGLISGVSCTSPTFCMIVDDEGHVARWNGASWSAVGSVVAKPTIEGLYGVSCTSPTFCLATAYYHSYAWDGVGWNVHNEVNRSVGQSTRLLDVSCASPTFCVGAGDQANVDEFTGGAWTSIPSIGADVALAVSCPTEHFCVVGDQGHVFVGRA